MRRQKERRIAEERRRHAIEGRRDARAHQQELERRAREADHDASFAGFMSPFQWDFGDEEYSGAAGSSVTGVPNSKSESSQHDFSRFAAFG